MYPENWELKEIIKHLSFLEETIVDFHLIKEGPFFIIEFQLTNGDYGI